MKTCPSIPSIAPRSRAAAAAAAIGCALLQGCQQYEPRPVDVAAHRAEFLARTPDLASGPGSGTAATPARPAGLPALTLEDAERVALYFNATLRRARREAGIALAASENGGLWTDPTVSLEFTRILQTVSNPNELFGGFNLSIPISGRLEIEKARLGLEHATALADVARLEWSTRMELRRTWTQWTALRRQLDAVLQFSGFVSGVVAVVDAMATTGEVARIEARLFRLEQMSASVEVQRLEAQCRQAELSIMRLLGLPPSFIARLEPSDLSPGSTAALDPDAEAVQRRILDSSPSLLVAKAEYEVAELRLKEEVARQLPDLQVSPNYGTQNAERQFLLGLAIPLPILNGNRQAIAEAFAAREAARVDIELELETAIAAVAFRHSELRAASMQREIFARDLVPLAELQYSEAREVARLGEVNTLALLEGLKRRKEAQTGLIAAQRDEAIAAIGIEEVVGAPAGQIAGGTR
jgi:cobalt-zinc-cadmium efflux system outer membrane protein